MLINFYSVNAFQVVGGLRSSLEPRMQPFHTHFERSILNSLADARCERFHLEWLGKNVHPVIETAARDGGVLCITGDEEDFELTLAASATCLPLRPPGRPTSVISRSIRALDSRTHSPADDHGRRAIVTILTRSDRVLVCIFIITLAR